MGFFKKALGGITSAVSPVNSLLGGVGGSSNAGFLAGIPFIGEGFAQEDTQQFNSAEALKNREFQNQMSSTAHQRQIEDMRKAGLNPILSAGAGASTPSGSNASSGMNSPSSATGGIIKDIMGKTSEKASKEIDLLDSKNTNEKTTNEFLKNEIIKSQNTARNISANTKATEISNTINQAKADYYKKYGAQIEGAKLINEFTNQSAKSLESLGGAVSGGLIKGAKSLFKGKMKTPQTREKTKIYPKRKGKVHPNYKGSVRP